MHEIAMRQFARARQREREREREREIGVNVAVNPDNLKKTLHAELLPANIFAEIKTTSSAHIRTVPYPTPLPDARAANQVMQQ